MLSLPLCSSNLIALLTAPYNHSPYSLLLLEQTIGNTDKNFHVHGVWTSRLSTELFEPVLTGTIQFYRQFITLKCQPNAINTYDIPIPTMGPKLHDTRARPLYDDAIFRLVQEDDDGNVNDSIEGPVTWGRGRGRGRGRGGKGKAATSIDPGPEPLTSTLEDQSRHQREKQRKDCHARNQEERESHSMDVFFGGTTPSSQHVTPPPPPQPGTPANEQHADPPASVQRVVITRII
ncbi:hypothetical protein JB92DRAFT_3132374 [Gautieria morchelliformis]|nr:hypothetical protein JB92DRAFT_3132374 [Gautieria morchelliformis]